MKLAEFWGSRHLSNIFNRISFKKKRCVEIECQILNRPIHLIVVSVLSNWPRVLSSMVVSGVELPGAD